MSGRKAKQHRREKRHIAIELAAAWLMADGVADEEQHKEKAARNAQELAALSDAKFFSLAYKLAQEVESRSNPFRYMTPRR